MKLAEKVIESSLLLCALSSVLIILLIFIFIIANGLPVLVSQGPLSFVFGGEWNPDFNIYGVFPLMIGSFVITVLALAISLPVGLCCAILMAEVAPGWARNILRPAIDTLAGIPSVLYGLFGLVILVPLIMTYLGGPGQSVLACGIVLAIMVLPTIISISEDSLRSVPCELREGSLSLGATKIQMITGIVVPSALSGIVASAVLAMGRAIGETMAVIMVCGGVAKVPTSLLSPVYPLTAVIASEWGYSSGDHQVALFAIGIVLLIIIMILNLIILFAKRFSISAHKV
jgi:phosphate transport system permease protein